MLTVQKFGGSSLAGAERMRRAAEISAEALRRGQQLVIVVSACGDTTDELSEAAYEINPGPSGRERDCLLSTGEQQSAALMALMLQSLGIPARSFTGFQAGIFTHGDHGSGRIIFIVPERIRAALAKGITPVIAGFQGMDMQGDICTLGRGGSDTTAVALAQVLGADCCEIYTDVNGIYTADPRLVSGAHLLDKVDYRDMLALSECGSQVLHSESVRIAMASGLKLKLLSSFENSPGSELCFLSAGERPDIAGVTRDSEKSEVSAVGRAASSVLLSELVPMLGSAGVPVLSGSTGSLRASVRVAPAQLLPALELVHSYVIK